MQDRIDRYIDGVEHLPPAPTLVVELMTLFRKPDRDVDEVLQLMSHEPSLTAEVLKRCNSAFFGGDGPIVDVSEAVFRLGFYEVYQMVAAMFAARAFSMPEISNVVPLDSLWHHSVTTAVAARTMASDLGETEGVAFTAGLLCNVGVLVLASAERSKYVELVRRSGWLGLDLARAERELLGLDHAEVGARLLSRWGMPPSIAIPVRHHHDLAGTESFKQTLSILILADRVARAICEGDATNPEHWDEEADTMLSLNFTPETMVSVMHRTQSGVKRIKGFIGAGKN